MALGYASVKAMTEEMTWGDWQNWQEYAAVEPFGEERGDLRIAQLCALYVNSHLSKGARPRKISDFMLFSDRERETHSARLDLSTEEGWKRWFASMGN